MICLLLLALSIAFPKPGQVLPAVKHCYVIGAASSKTVQVNGNTVNVYHTGGWIAYVEVSGGANEITVIAGSETSSVPITVTVPAKPSAEVLPVKAKVRGKLDYAADVPRASLKGLKPAEITIALDAGHGGKVDTGTLSPHGWAEKSVNLAVTLALDDKLRKLGYRTLLTRTNDTALVLSERPRLAHRKQAACFVSIHHNAPACDVDPRKTRYCSAYYWNTIGRKLSDCLVHRLGEALDGEVPNCGSISNEFAVTRSPEIPSCLVEVDFITTPEGEESSWNPDRIDFVAEALAKGIRDWCRLEGAQ